MENPIERSLQREVVRLMMVTDYLSESLARLTQGDRDQIQNDAFARARVLIDPLPDSYIEALLQRKKPASEVTVDVSNID